MKFNDVYYLSEVMDFKGVINKDIGIIDKNLTLKYISSGIDTDHGCLTIEYVGCKVICRDY